MEHLVTRGRVCLCLCGYDEPAVSAGNSLDGTAVSNARGVEVVKATQLGRLSWARKGRQGTPENTQKPIQGPAIARPHIQDKTEGARLAWPPRGRRNRKQAMVFSPTPSWGVRTPETLAFVPKHVQVDRCLLG